jgi:hypothetical protein
MHIVPAVLLVLAVLGVVGFDLLGPRIKSRQGDEVREGWSYNPDSLRDQKPRLGVQFNRNQRFGLVMLDAEDPENRDAHKKLTARTDGSTNNTIVKIAGAEYYFGFVSRGISEWVVRARKLPEPRHGWVSKMRFRNEQILVTQHVEIVPGKTEGETTGTALLDTCLIYYSIKNESDSIPQKVGLRFLLDTYIGNNDGVPFTIPGRKGFVSGQLTLKGDQIPDYIEVIERPDVSEKNLTTARLALRGLRLPGVDLTEPDMLRICKFPGAQARWDWTPEDMGDDSAVAIYWPYEELEPKQTRHMAFTYGLSDLALGDRLVVSAPSSTVPSREFVITCYVYNSSQGQKVTLNLPAGLELASGETAEKVVDTAAKRTQVFWRVRAAEAGAYPVSASSGQARSADTKVVVKATSIFG